MQQWPLGNPFILTSGTLSASGDFARTMQTMGIGKIPSGIERVTDLPGDIQYKRGSRLHTDKKDVRLLQLGGSTGCMHSMALIIEKCRNLRFRR